MAEQEDGRHRYVIDRESAKLDRDRARAEALGETMRKTISATMKQANVKQVLAKDAMAATKDPGRRDDIFDKAGNGLYNDDREVITGSEPRPWES
jgi:hypothetical protein